jgi:glycosyltransferase involved in cell wall biosynthesis
MKPAFVTTSITRDAGGLFIAMSHLAKSLCERGIKSDIYGLTNERNPEDEQAWHPLLCHKFKRKGPTSLGYAPDLTNALLRGDHELLHTHGIWQWPSVAVHTWHKKTRKPYLVSPHGMLDPWALANASWKKRIAAACYENRHLRDAACIHALCQSEAESIRAYGLKNPVCIIPNGVDLPRETEDRFAQRQKTEDRGKILLFLGRIHPKKGLVNALRAWHKIRSQGSSNRDHQEWQFVITGWDQGGHEAELKKLCDELKLDYAEMPAAEFLNLTPDSRPLTPIIFTGPAFGAEKDALMRSSNAFVLPSFSEGLPMSVLEAWSYRLPVLMTDHCNLPEGFAANAAIHISNDVDCIAEGMRHLLRSPTSYLQCLGQNGRALVEHQFTWPQVAAQMKDVYQWILGDAPRPDSVVL